MLAFISDLFLLVKGMYMKITTEKFGEVEFDESSVITFSDGILGFPENKKYVLINTQENFPFKWLQDIEDNSLAFLVVDPFIFKPDYIVNLPEIIKNDLDIKLKEDYVVFVIVVVRTDPKESTANILGPLVINVKNKKAKQIVQNNTDYTTQYKLLGKDK
jgi:flagellar assembly factor FliW